MFKISHILFYKSNVLSFIIHLNAHGTLHIGILPLFFYLLFFQFWETKLLQINLHLEKLRHTTNTLRHTATCDHRLSLLQHQLWDPKRSCMTDLSVGLINSRHKWFLQLHPSVHLEGMMKDSAKNIYCLTLFITLLDTNSQKHTHPYGNSRCLAMSEMAMLVSICCMMPLRHSMSGNYFWQILHKLWKTLGI